MKRLITKILTITACAAMLLGAVPAADADTIQASLTAVNVSAATPIKSTINMAKTKNVTVFKGNRYRMKAVIKKKTITTKGKWTSSNKKVATVAKNGVITAVKAGKTTIKVTYKGKSLKTVVKVKSVCIHKWKTTKKATCKTAGKQTCTVCGAAKTVAKTAHKYVSKTWTGVEGRGKPYYVTSFYCNGCGIDMTDWKANDMSLHWHDIEGMSAGTANWDCWGAGTNGLGGEERYSKYVVVENMETYCKTCGSHKDIKETDLYEVYIDEWRNVVRKSDNKIIEESVWYKKAKPYLEAAKKTASQAKAASVAMLSDEIPVEDVAVAEPEGEISMYAEDIAVSDNEIAMDEAVDATEAVISADE